MTRHINILIVDDEEGIREILSNVADEIGAQHQEAQDGEEAFELIKNYQFDLIISDIMMPKKTGIELLEIMRQNSMYEPFIVITGFASKNFAIQALKLGAYDFIEKPFNLEEIKSVILSAITHSQNLANIRNSIEIDFFNPKNKKLTIEEKESLLKISNLMALKSKK